MNLAQLQALETAAIDSCLQQGIDPHERKMNEHGCYYPAWYDEAEALFELKLRLNVLRQFGVM